MKYCSGRPNSLVIFDIIGDAEDAVPFCGGDIARVCLEQLTGLIDELGNDKIVFAHDLGEWMITSRFDYKGVFWSLQE